MMTIQSLKSGRARRTYSPQFKAEMVEKCLQKTVSLTSLAVANGMNPNVLHRWVTEHKQLGRHDHHASPLPAPDEVATPTHSSSMLLPLSSASNDCSDAQTIRLDIKRGDTHKRVSWPLSDSQACINFLKEWLA